MQAAPARTSTLPVDRGFCSAQALIATVARPLTITSHQRRDSVAELQSSAAWCSGGATPGGQPQRWGSQVSARSNVGRQQSYRGKTRSTSPCQRTLTVPSKGVFLSERSVHVLLASPGSLDRVESGASSARLPDSGRCRSRQSLGTTRSVSPRMTREASLSARSTEARQQRPSPRQHTQHQLGHSRSLTKLKGLPGAAEATAAVRGEQQMPGQMVSMPSRSGTASRCPEQQQHASAFAAAGGSLHLQPATSGIHSSPPGGSHMLPPAPRTTSSTTSICKAVPSTSPPAQWRVVPRGSCCSSLSSSVSGVQTCGHKSSSPASETRWQMLPRPPPSASLCHTLPASFLGHGGLTSRPASAAPSSGHSMDDSLRRSSSLTPRVPCRVAAAGGGCEVIAFVGERDKAILSTTASLDASGLPALDITAAPSADNTPCRTTPPDLPAVVDCGDQRTHPLMESPIAAHTEQPSPSTCSPADLNASSRTLPPGSLARSPGDFASPAASPLQRIGPDGSNFPQALQDVTIALSQRGQGPQLTEVPKAFLVKRINVLESEVSRLTKMLMEERIRSRTHRGQTEGSNHAMQTPRAQGSGAS